MWRWMREAAAGSSAGYLERGASASDPDADGIPDNEDPEDISVQMCPSCGGTGIKGADLCPRCKGAGALVKESTCGPYWVYSDDPEWQELREATHPAWEWMQEAPRTFSSDVRKKYAASGVAMDDGSYPIPDADALRRAVASYGRNPTPAVKAHIMKRARALGKSDSLPDDWKSSKEAGVANFGKNKAAPFGKDKKDSKNGDSKNGDGKGDKEDDDKPPWLKNKESEEGMLLRLDALEEEFQTFARLREAKPASMTPAFSTPIRVKTSSGNEGYRVALIREGKGNNEDDQWYTADAIKEMCESGVCEGMQAYANHPTEEEEETRPERDVKELVGTYHDVTFKESSSGKAYAEGIFVPLTLDENHPRYGWVVTLAEAAARSQAPQPICGISLLGLSAGDNGPRPDGSQGRMVDMIRPYSGDIVTTAGAGGGFLRQVMESARALRNRTQKEPEPMKALEYQAKMREAAKRVREADSDEDRLEALREMETLETETIDGTADLTIETLREAAPQLVDQISQQAKAEDGKTIEELREENAGLKSSLNRFTDAVNLTTALREAGVEDPVELRHYHQQARILGLTDASEIKGMVETDRAMEERRLAKMKESIGDLGGDIEIEGVVARIPAGALPQDGGVDVLRESGLPLVSTDAN